MTTSVEGAAAPLACSWYTLLIWSLVLVALAQASYASPERAAQALTFDQPPTIDGKLDDACWQQGTWASDFTAIKGDQARVPLQTRFKFGMDQRHLYIALEMDQPAETPLVTRVDQRDGPVWRDDVIEMMIAPTPALGDYIHLVVNAKAAVHDAMRVQGGQLADQSFNMTLDVATQVKDEKWTIELALPLADLGLSASTSSQWSFNIARSSRATSKAEVSSFVPIVGNLHDPSRFAPLELPGLDPSPFQWTLTPRGTSRVVMDRGQLFVETQLSLTNNTPSYEFFSLQTRLVQDEAVRGQKDLVAGLEAGASRVYSVRIPFEGDGQAVVQVTLHNKRLEMPVRRRQYPIDLTHTPMAMSLSAPAYRQTIYATQKLKAIRGQLALNLSQDQLAKGTLEIWLQSAEGKLVSRAPQAAASAQVKFEIPLASPLQPGEYRVVAKLSLAGASKPAETSLSLRQLPPPSNGGREVRLDEHRVTRVDGKPFLPFGSMIIRPEDDLEAVAKQGYTVVFEYAYYWWDQPKQQAWLDRVHELGMMAVLYPYPEPAMTREGQPTRPLSDEESQKIRAFIQKWKDHPALLAWYLADEPELHAMLPARIEAVYQLCREVDPYHPAILLNNTPSGIDTYSQWCDILMPNPFPGFLRNGGPRRGIHYVYQLVAHAEEAVDGMRGIWATPQAFNWADLRKDRQDERIPTFGEVRNMNYQAVIAGATGSISYAYGRGRRHPSIRLGQAYLAQEMHLLRDAVLALDTAQTLKTPRRNDQVLHTFRSVGGDHFLFVVNVSTQPQEAAFELPLAVKGSWHVVSEGRSIKLENDRLLRETLEPLATRIYTTRASAASALSLERMQSVIDQAPTFEDPEQPLPPGEVSAAADH